MTFRVACAQFAPEKGAVERNLDRIADLAVQAGSEGAQLVVFPETATSGYFVEGAVLQLALGADEICEKLSGRLAGRAQRLDLLIGFYEQSRGLLHNSAGYFEWDGTGCRPVHLYRKFFLPTYGVFDEERFVSAGRELGVFDTRFGRAGILICEDTWHSILPTLLAVNGAEFVFVPSASPARGFEGEVPSNLDRYARMLRGISEEHGVFCINSMLCGFEGGKGFVGGSMVVDPFGAIIGQGPLQEEFLLLADVDLDLVTVARAQLPLLSDLRSAWGEIQRIVSETPGQ
jgi:predicted amidohydrolase